MMAVAERHHRRNALDPEGARQILVGVDVDLDQIDLAAARGHRALEYGTKLPARTAPLGPEVDHHRHNMRAVYDRGLEGAFGCVHRY
jgi:hypothetical protein